MFINIKIKSPVVSCRRTGVRNTKEYLYESDSVKLGYFPPQQEKCYGWQLPGSRGGPAHSANEALHSAILGLDYPCPHLKKLSISVQFRYLLIFWLRQEPKVSLCMSVCPSGTSLSRALNLHLSSLYSSWWLHDDFMMSSGWLLL